MGVQDLIGEDLSNAGGWYYVAGQSNRPRIFVNLGQIKVIRTLDEFIRVEALSDRRRRSLVVSRDPSFSISWTGDRLHVSRVSSARFLGVDAFNGPLTNLFVRAVLVSEDDAFIGYRGVHSNEDGLRGCILQVADGDIVPWRERGVHIYDFVSRSRLFPDC